VSNDNDVKCWEKIYRSCNISFGDIVVEGGRMGVIMRAVLHFQKAAISQIKHITLSMLTFYYSINIKFIPETFIQIKYEHAIK
jgi:hypothetical protein